MTSVVTQLAVIVEVFQGQIGDHCRADHSVRAQETPALMQMLAKICKGQTNRWQDGKPVTLVVRDPASQEMKVVLQKVYELPKEDVSALITSANHSRQNHPAIIVVDSDEALVKKVESTPGSVGLVDVYAITGGVTVMRIDNKLPLEPGYLLHGN